MTDDPLCRCGHRRSEHNDNDPIEPSGCLNGWGVPMVAAHGCLCRGFEFWPHTT